MRYRYEEPPQVGKCLKCVLEADDEPGPTLRAPAYPLPLKVGQGQFQSQSQSQLQVQDRFDGPPPQLVSAWVGPYVSSIDGTHVYFLRGDVTREYARGVRATGWAHWSWRAINLSPSGGRTHGPWITVCAAAPMARVWTCPPGTTYPPIPPHPHRIEAVGQVFYATTWGIPRGWACPPGYSWQFLRGGMGMCVPTPQPLPAHQEQQQPIGLTYLSPSYPYGGTHPPTYPYGTHPYGACPDGYYWNGHTCVPL